jgi:pSer/pThr/pTyr-binding forkhead associated (FHA) protein
MAKIIFLIGNRPRKSLIQGLRTTIGRASENSIVLDDGTVSGTLCHLCFEEKV